uniref:Uncharacterized protein n=1 Tax=Zea mays TaxID=4577 RepID=C0PBF6_MAIZE|nr:unknown [Zea mays]
MGEVAPVTKSTGTLQEVLAQLRLVVAALAPWTTASASSCWCRGSRWIFRWHACADGCDEITHQVAGLLDLVKIAFQLDVL